MVNCIVGNVGNVGIVGSWCYVDGGVDNGICGITCIVVYVYADIGGIASMIMWLMVMLMAYVSLYLCSCIWWW